MKLEIITLPPIGENCYILHDGKECVVFDPGSYFEIIKKYIDDNKLQVKYILNTHAHFDHVGAAAELKEYSGAPFMLHSGDMDILRTSDRDAMRFGLPAFPIPSVDKVLSEGDIIKFNGVDIKVIHTPGHTAGCVCFLIVPDNILISGDTLFYESVGRTDFPYSSSRDIVNSIKEKLYVLELSVKVMPGHGGATSIGHERENNPFVNA